MSDSGYQRVTFKVLTLGALLTCLFMLPGTGELAGQQDATGRGATDAEISVALQDDAPLRISVLSHQQTDPRAHEIVFQLTNVGGKPIRAYSIVQETVGEGQKSAGFILTDIDSTNATLHPGQYLTDTITYQPLTGRNSRVTLSIDLVEYSDGILWGGDKRKSSEVLSGRRAGVRDAQRRVLVAFKSQGLAAAIQTLQSGPAADMSAGGSPEWGDGYRHGFTHAIGRLRRLLDNSGERQLEAELRRIPVNQ